MADKPRTEADLLLEIARLYAALIRVVREIDSPTLKAEIVALIWPRTATTEEPMTQPVVVDPMPPFWVNVANVAKNTIERTVVTFVIGMLSIGGVAGLSDFSTDFGKKVSTAGLFAVAAFITSLAWPKAGFGLPPLADVAARAAFSAAQAAAVFIVANQQLDWFVVTNWQLVGGMAIAAGLSVLKGFVASRINPNGTVTPASLITASPPAPAVAGAAVVNQ